ncbi:unnamed protein product [Phaeothamnion confervicola]
MITIAGDFVSADVWHRIIHIVSNNKDLQAYAADRLYGTLQSRAAHETAVCVGGYILGEFGYFIAEQTSGPDQFRALHQHFPGASSGTKALLLSTYVKLSNLYPECRALVEPVFAKYASNPNLELQQRACEYRALPTMGIDIMEEVLREMPPFPEDRESGPEAALRRRLEEQQDEGGIAGAGARSPGRGGGENGRGGDDDDDVDGSGAGGGGKCGVVAAAPPPVVVNDLLDVGDLESAPAPAPATNGVHYSGGTAGGVNDFGNVAGGGGDTNPAAADRTGGPVVTVPPEMYPAMLRWFNAASMAGMGVIYEDSVFKVGVVQEYRSSQARIMLYYYCLGSAPLEAFSAAVPPQPYLRMQAQDAAVRLEPGQAPVRQQVMCECMQPFSGAPELMVAFTCGGRRHSYALRLPLVASCFMEPAALSPQDFAQRWALLAGEPREQSEVIAVTSGPVDTARMEMVRQKLSAGMRMGIVAAGAADNGFAAALGVGGGIGGAGAVDWTVAAAGTFCTGATSPDGEKLSVGAMVTVMGQPAQGRVVVTARAVHWKVAEALKDILKVQIA